MDRFDIFVGGLILVLFLLLLALPALACSQYEDTTGRKTEYRFPAGCFVEHEGEMVYWNEIRTLNEQE